MSLAGGRVIGCQIGGRAIRCGHRAFAARASPFDAATAPPNAVQPEPKVSEAGASC
jgi:hypothetical protein